MPTTQQRKRRVDGGGPVGCGFGVLLGLAVGIIFFLRFGGWGVALAVAVAFATGFLGWRLGDTFFEKVLSGDPEGKPSRYWWFR
jgi:hypothetical protein